MLTARLLTAAAVLYAVSAVPTEKLPKPVTTITDVDIDDAPWFSFPLFGNLFAPLWRLFPSFADIGPRIISDDKKFQVIVNVKDYKKDDLKVKVKGDFIFVQGSHEAKQDDRDIFASQFFHTYTLPVNSSAADVTSELTSDGFLIVTAPVEANADKSNTEVKEFEVPIVETGKPYQKEEPVSQPTSTAAPEDDRKEPTTSSEISDVTERKDKDNEIPL